MSSLLKMCAARHDMVEIAHGFCSPNSPTYVSLPGWRPVPSALGWSSAIYTTAACDHPGVVLLGGCYISRLLSDAFQRACHFVTRAYAGLHRGGLDVEMKLL